MEKGNPQIYPPYSQFILLKQPHLAILVIFSHFFCNWPTYTLMPLFLKYFILSIFTIGKTKV